MIMRRALRRPRKCCEYKYVPSNLHPRSLATDVAAAAHGVNETISDRGWGGNPQSRKTLDDAISNRNGRAEQAGEKSRRGILLGLCIVVRSTWYAPNTARTRLSGVAHTQVVPDPAPLLESALQRQRHAAELEVENEKLNKTVKEYHTEFANIKNQEVTVKRLQEQLEEYEVGSFCAFSSDFLNRSKLWVTGTNGRDNARAGHREGAPASARV